MGVIMANSLCNKDEKCTKSQRDAAKHFEGPLLIVAGPGAGKTRVLVERVAYLVKKKNVRSKQHSSNYFHCKSCRRIESKIKSLCRS